MSGFLKAPRRKIAAKTAAYYIKPEDEGTLFTNAGASGAVTFTLPPRADIPDGWSCQVFTVAGQNVTVAADVADTLVTFNDAAADSITWSTAGDLIGNGAEFIYSAADELWFCLLFIEGAVVTTVTTA